MDDVATKIIEILRKNMKDPSKPVALETPLSELEIESLDLAVIVREALEQNWDHATTAARLREHVERGGGPVHLQRLGRLRRAIPHPRPRGSTRRPGSGRRARSSRRGRRR